MSDQLVLVVDCNFMCWRALHTMGGLRHGGVATGVTYGFFKDLLALEDELGTCAAALCWDVGRKTKRHEILPTYKHKRHSKELSEDELRTVTEMREQMKALRSEILPELGFTNLFGVKGFEADDCIAAVCRKLSEAGARSVIVSADKDLYQLLSDSVSMWNPTTKKATTEKTFRDEWNLDPVQWAAVKAIAGCSSDQIPGVKGVGEKTAAAYVGKRLPNSSAKYQGIVDFIVSGKYTTNLKLTKLPFPGLPDFEVSADPVSVSRKKWARFCAEHGFKSLAPRVPGTRTGFGVLPMPKRRTDGKR